jgi:phosphohistidine phosphatase SixA
MACWANTARTAEADEAWALLQDPKRASVVLFRHATAPGGGDPPGFQLGDCSTQRNLDDAGRAQARRIGEQFRSRGVKVTAVRHSMWCRTRETAELAFPGLARGDGDFNSFFEDRSREPAQTAAALATLLKWRGPGVLVVVTHQVNITALTGVVPASGEGVVLRRHGDGKQHEKDQSKHRRMIVVGRITP